MAQFDPLLRRETWLFQKIGTDPGNKPLYRRMGFNLVTYDESPDAWIEPVAAILSSGVNPLAANVTTLDDAAKDAGAIAGIERYDARPFEVHAFGDPVST